MIQNEKLMRLVWGRWGKTISDACRNTAVCPEFLAALTANESGGDPAAVRFEPKVYAHLKAVVEGKESAYGSIKPGVIAVEVSEFAQEILDAIANRKTDGYHVAHLADFQFNPVDYSLRELASSWGLTQIMGYHMIARQGTVLSLVNPELHYPVAVELLEDFSRRFHLNVTEDFGPLFRCWNTGQPNGATYDPGYVSIGLKRMEIVRAMRAPIEIDTARPVRT